MFDESMHIDVSELLNFNEADIKIICSDAATTAAEVAREVSVAPATPELDSQAELVRGLLQEFKSLTVRACDTAVREAQHAANVEELAGVEFGNLKLQLKARSEALDLQQRQFQTLQSASAEKIDSMEIALRDKDAQLQSCQGRSGALLAEIDGLNLRLNEAASAIKQAETRFRDFADHQQHKINDLREEVKAQQQALQEKDSALEQLEQTSRATIGELERQLQSAMIQLEAKEIVVRDKEAALQAAAAREHAITQLIQQLAAESQRLMAELREKNQLVSEIENRSYRPLDAVTAANDGPIVQ